MRWKSAVRKWRRVFLLGALLLIPVSLFETPLIAGPASRSVILMWEHEAGPYSYNVYESTNLIDAWGLKTNTPNLAVQLPVESGEHYFAVTCVDTNNGLESTFATK